MNCNLIAKIYISKETDEIKQGSCYYTYAVVNKRYESKRLTSKKKWAKFIYNEVKEIDYIPKFKDIDLFLEVFNTNLINTKHRYKRIINMGEKLSTILEEIKEMGFDVKSSLKGDLITWKAEKNGIEFTRTGKEMCQTIKSLKFDIINSNLV